MNRIREKCEFNQNNKINNNSIIEEYQKFKDILNNINSNILEYEIENRKNKKQKIDEHDV